MKRIIIYLFLFQLTIPTVFGQYEFTGKVDRSFWEGNVFLSVIEDYRKSSGIFPEQIIAKSTPDSLGNFRFLGNNLPDTNRLYRIHVDNCNENEQQINHFSGICKNSRDILFIANNSDSISFPFSFDEEMFCKVESSNEKAGVFLKIDSLKNNMMYDFGSYTSEANRKINSKKWYDSFLNFGMYINEPIAELYIYSILSSRSSKLYNYYLKDLKNNTYYYDLLNRLEKEFPESSYSIQFKNELLADKFIADDNTRQNIPWWGYFVLILLMISMILNLYFFKKLKSLKNKNSPYNKLTNQERRILNLIKQNKSNKEIASEIYVSVSTVKTHINNIYKKLNVSSREDVKKL